MSFRLIWPTRSRSGSQFVVGLTRSLFGSSIGKLAMVNGARRDTTAGPDAANRFKEMFSQGDGIEYVRANGISAMKYEDPGKDDFVLELMDAFPEARAVTSYRRLEDVIVSHYNIRKWGHDEGDVLYQFSASLPMFKRLFERGQLYMIDIESPQSFSLDEFSSFLGVAPTSAARKIVDEWQPINTLSYQQDKHDGGEHGRQLPPRIERLREIHPWIDGLEREYKGMCNRVAEIQE